ncbi:MAG: TetR/AcrR family transcriptional regulator, partial [Candidatus Heimdallarchaeota archaeon]|nr:TetR/AcrR family transcriptional regulator [Candidatus Heimdallarchaeota archaeon]
MGRKSTAKARMIGVGKKLFHKYGYQDVSIAQICEKAEVRTGSFFHFFSSKEAFVQLVIDEYWDEFRSMVVSQLQDLEFSPLKRIM